MVKIEDVWMGLLDHVSSPATYEKEFVMDRLKSWQSDERKRVEEETELEDITMNNKYELELFRSRWRSMKWNEFKEDYRRVSAFKDVQTRYPTNADSINGIYRKQWPVRSSNRQASSFDQAPSSSGP